MPKTPEELSVDQARELIRGVDLRCTSCRVAVLQRLSAADSPRTHADIADDLVPAGFDKSTIYRCLVEMADAGLCARLDLGDHVWRFEFLRGDASEHVAHPHFMCLDCGKVECLSGVDVRIAAPKGGRRRSFGEVKEVLLKGQCVDCV